MQDRCLRSQYIYNDSLIEQQSTPESHYVARFIQLNFKYLTSFFLIATVLYNILTFCVMPQLSKTVICVTCIVHALAMTFRIFFLFRCIVPAR